MRANPGYGAVRASKTGAEKTLAYFADLDPHWIVSRSSAGCREWRVRNSSVSSKRAVLARWRRAPCPPRDPSVAACQGREAQLGLALQTFWAPCQGRCLCGKKETSVRKMLDRAAATLMKFTDF